MRMIVALLCVLYLALGSAAHAQDAEAQRAPAEIALGIYINNIPAIDPETNSFELDAFFRFTWDDPTLDPVRTMEVANPYHGWQARITPVFDSPQRLEDGRFFNILRYQGRFAAPLDLGDYPFDRHVLRVVLRDTHTGARAVIYRPDSAPAAIAPEVTLKSYRIGTPSLTVTDPGPPPEFGPTALAGASTTSRAELTIPLSRNGAVFGTKTIFPILVIVVTGLLALFLDHDLASARVGLLATTLLSLIVLQLSTAPSSHALTLLDTLFILGRLILAIGLLRVVLSHHAHLHGGGAAALRTDRSAALALIGALFAGTVALAAAHVLI